MRSPARPALLNLICEKATMQWIMPAVFALGVAAAGVEAQVREITLTQPNATFPEAFSLVNGLRELPDGRVMIADPLGQALVVADFAAGKADTLGRVGQGPNEYQQPDGLFALPGDSTLLVDLGNGRLTVLGPDGSFGETMPIARGGGGFGPGGMTFVFPRAVDAKGRIYFQTMGAGPGGGIPDSAPVVRWDRGAGSMDTIVMVKLEGRTRSESGGPTNRNVQIQPTPLSPQDAWGAAPDGRVAVARAIDYHVEWIGPGRQVTSGPKIEHKPVPIRQAEKEAWAERLGSTGLQVSMTIDNGERRTSFRRGGGGGGWSPELARLEWPEFMPPFVPNAVLVAPNGEMWVERSIAHGSARQFDVFGPDARLARRVILPPRRRLVGLGRSAIYLVRVDDLDLEWLERYK